MIMFFIILYWSVFWKTIIDKLHWNVYDHAGDFPLEDNTLIFGTFTITEMYNSYVTFASPVRGPEYRYLVLRI